MKIETVLYKNISEANSKILLDKYSIKGACIMSNKYKKINEISIYMSMIIGIQRVSWWLYDNNLINEEEWLFLSKDKAHKIVFSIKGN